MNINVGAEARGHFWEEPPAGAVEFWSFRFSPPCKVGELLIFRFDGIAVATAIVDRIERPGHGACDSTGRFENGWKVFWRPETFNDLRSLPAEQRPAPTVVAKDLRVGQDGLFGNAGNSGGRAI
jgi:hypothetical protein